MYKYNTPKDVSSVGFLLGFSFTGNVAAGSGDWTGPFDSVSASYKLITGGYFESPRDQPGPGFRGISFGVGKGPIGVGSTRSNYIRMYPDKK